MAACSNHSRRRAAILLFGEAATLAESASAPPLVLFLARPSGPVAAACSGMGAILHARAPRAGTRRRGREPSALTERGQTAQSPAAPHNFCRSSHHFLLFGKSPAKIYADPYSCTRPYARAHGRITDARKWAQMHAGAAPSTRHGGASGSLSHGAAAHVRAYARLGRSIGKSLKRLPLCDSGSPPPSPVATAVPREPPPPARGELPLAIGGDEYVLLPAACRLLTHAHTSRRLQRSNVDSQCATSERRVPAVAP